MNNFWFKKYIYKFFYSSLIDQSEEESKKPKIEENHQTTTHPDTHPDPQLPSDEDMEDILEHIDEDVEIPDDEDDTDLEDTDMITDTIPMLKGIFFYSGKIFFLSNRLWENFLVKRQKHQYLFNKSYL